MVDTLEHCRLDRRRRAIVDAACQLFIDQGFERTTLNAIVEAAGGSLATVYKLFGNKDGLLEAVVFEKAASGSTYIDEIAKSNLSPAVALRAISERLYDRFLDTETVALVRIVIARSVCEPKLARRFFDRTSKRTGHALEQLFLRWDAEGVSMNGDPQTLAEVFLDLFVSDLHKEAISHGVCAGRSTDRLRKRTDFFIAGAGIGQEAI